MKRDLTCDRLDRIEFSGYFTFKVGSHKGGNLPWTRPCFKSLVKSLHRGLQIGDLVRASDLNLKTLIFAISVINRKHFHVGFEACLLTIPQARYNSTLRIPKLRLVCKE